MPALDAFSHLSLTVRDPQYSAGFYAIELFVPDPQ
ncbi:MAG: hypothetical protein QOH84_5405 [Kribbellaceae bacterium]|nr:hypothetical protein [Kribbellaceae bacterium]